MHTRPLDKNESASLRKLAEAGLECSLIYLTWTGLDKGYFDATIPVRSFLVQHGIHDYSAQGLGQKDHGVYVEATIYEAGKARNITISMYRPKSKKGDPRMWPSKLHRCAEPDDVLAIFCIGKQIHLLNLTQDIQLSPFIQESDLSLLLSELSTRYNSTAHELLSKLQALAHSGPLLADGHGDTSIGRTVETALGIPMNSSKEPDYKGIELKSKRRASKTRQSLFAKVPDWDLSAYKSVRAIINKFGYDVDGLRKLNCSVYATKVNSQGLFLDLKEELEQLHELFKNGEKSEPVCLWKTPTLHYSLLEKHQETFWITADEIKSRGKKYFHLQKVKHTRRPSTVQFNRLLSTGEISVDHMIKQSGNKVRERGPQFKIKGAALEELFIGVTREYQLDI